MNNFQHIIDHAEKHCQSQGARLTNKRKQVLSSLLQANKALSAYELIECYEDQYDETLPAMSAYRILDFLQNEQLVHKLELTNKYIVCTHIACDHEHDIPQFLICSQCRKVKEINIDKSTIKALQKNLVNTGFHLLSPQLEMKCICENCMSNID